MAANKEVSVAEVWEPSCEGGGGGGGGFGLPVSLGRLMIGKWRRFKSSPSLTRKKNSLKPK